VAVSGSYAYVADWDAGLRIIEYYGVGVAEETMNDERGTMNAGPTIVRGVLHLQPSPFPLPMGEGEEVRARSVLLDASGRKVMALHPGANDVSRLSSGVYFLRQAQGGHNRNCVPVPVHKVVLTR
jgi:hypothetical protein